MWRRVRGAWGGSDGMLNSMYMSFRIVCGLFHALVRGNILFLKGTDPHCGQILEDGYGGDEP